MSEAEGHTIGRINVRASRDGVMVAMPGEYQGLVGERITPIQARDLSRILLEEALVAEHNSAEMRRREILHRESQIKRLKEEIETLKSGKDVD